MDLDNHFGRYQKLKKSLKGHQYKGVPLDQLSAYFIADGCYLDTEKKSLSLIKRIIKKLLFVPAVQFFSNDKPIFGWTFDREDYHRLSDAYLISIGGDFEKICCSESVVGRTIRFDFEGLKLALRAALVIKKLTFYDKLILILSIYESINFFEYICLRVGKANPKYYLSFNSSFAYESIITLFFKKRGIKTFSIQHGMYFEYKNKIPIDVLNYENVTADYLLLWGQYSKNQIAKYLPPHATPIIFGYPLLSSINEKRVYKKRTDRLMLKERSNGILVCLPRVIYEDEVLALLQVLSNDCFNDIEFVIRPHPNFRQELIHNFINTYANFSLSNQKTIADEIDSKKYLFLLSFNSTVLFEALLYDLVPVQFVSGNDEFDRTGFYEFSNKEQFLGVIELVKGGAQKTIDKRCYFDDVALDLKERLFG